MSGGGSGDWPRLRLPRTRSAKLIQESLDEFDFNRAAVRLYDAGGEAALYILPCHIEGRLCFAKPAKEVASYI
jgi:hypothetical protein